MSRAYELFYANHSLESEIEPCALCFQAAETTPPKNACFCLPCHQTVLFCCIPTTARHQALVSQCVCVCV